MIKWDLHLTNESPVIIPHEQLLQFRWSIVFDEKTNEDKKGRSRELKWIYSFRYFIMEIRLFISPYLWLFFISQLLKTFIRKYWYLSEKIRLISTVISLWSTCPLIDEFKFLKYRSIALRVRSTKAIGFWKIEINYKKEEKSRKSPFSHSSSLQSKEGNE